MIKIHTHSNTFWEFQTSIRNLALAQEYQVALELFNHERFPEAIEYLNNLILHFPPHPEVLTLLSDACDQEDDLPMAYLAAALAHQLYQAALPKDFVPGKHFLPWDYPGNQAFLHNCRHLADLYDETGNQKGCREICEWTLKIDPADELGLRTLLPKVYMEEKNIIAMHRLNRQYPEDYAPEILFGALYLAIVNGDTNTASRLWHEAELEFPLVVAELLKTHHQAPPDYDPNIAYYSDTEETAWSYWVFYGGLWQEHPKVVNYLEEKRKRL